MKEGVITGLPLFKQGKVREIYDLADCLLMVASDRISCFDVVLATEIPGKGKILSAEALRRLTAPRERCCGR